MSDINSVSIGIPKRWIDKALILLWAILSAGGLLVWNSARASEIKNIQQDERIDNINKRMDSVDTKLDRQDAKLDRIFDKVK